MTELVENTSSEGIGDLKAWIAPDRTALCVIDIQVDFAAPDGLLAGFGVDMSAVPAAIAKTEGLIATARKAGVPVIFIGLSTSPHCMRGSTQYAPLQFKPWRLITA